jgi:hypothetical protein
MYAIPSSPSDLKLVDLVIDNIVDLGIEPGGETLLAGELIDG